MNDTITILVADDERPIREGCHRVLTGNGYRVLTAENGRVALDSLSKDDVDILLLDLKMPVMGGEEVLEVVRHGTRTCRSSSLPATAPWTRLWNA